MSCIDLDPGQLLAAVLAGQIAGSILLLWAFSLRFPAVLPVRKRKP